MKNLTLRKALLKTNILFMREYPFTTIFKYDFDRNKVLNIPNRFLFWWFKNYDYYNLTPERVVRSLANNKIMYKTSFSEYGSDSTCIVIEIKKRRCKKGDRYARRNYIWKEWYQYGYVVWREDRNGDYVKEFQTHYEHVLCEYLLKTNLKKYAD